MSKTDWKDYYKKHCVSVDEAVSHIKSGDLIIDGHGCGRSDIFGPALMKRADELHDVRLRTGFNMGHSPHVDPQYEGHFIHDSLFNIGETRQAHWEGRATFTPIHFSQQDKAIRAWKPDILFTHVTPPNEEGLVSMGVSCDFTRAAVDEAKLVIAQVNKNMPWIEGDGVIPVTKIDYFVEEDTPLPIIPEVEKASDIDSAIAQNIASIINDGDTLQVGVGAVPDTVLSMLKDHKHLGIHTELGTTGIMNLMKAGVVDNSMKTLDKGKVVCTLIGGTSEFFHFVDKNPDFLMKRSSYVLDPCVIAQQKNMVAMNSAIEIDLYGQICAEMIGGKQFSGIGGQLDFLRGAMMSEGGKSIICLPSTASKGKKSRIVANLSDGSVVTDGRCDVMYVVTEFGIADLWAKNNDQRARQLIDIAHPDFRAQLEVDFWNRIHKVV